MKDYNHTMAYRVQYPGASKRSSLGAVGQFGRAVAVEKIRVEKVKEERIVSVQGLFCFRARRVFNMMEGHMEHNTITKGYLEC